jgi:hypothetical protein
MAVNPAETRRRLRAALEASDHAAVVAVFAPDVVLNSPIIGTQFEGRHAVADLMAAVIATFRDIRYTAEGEAEGVQFLNFTARVRGRHVEAVDVIRVDDRGLIGDITVLIRPMASLAAVAAALGPHLARGRVTSVLVRLFTVPLAALLAAAEPLIPRLIRTRSS